MLSWEMWREWEVKLKNFVMINIHLTDILQWSVLNTCLESYQEHFSKSCDSVYYSLQKVLFSCCQNNISPLPPFPNHPQKKFAIAFYHREHHCLLYYIATQANAILGFPISDSGTCIPYLCSLAVWCHVTIRSLIWAVKLVKKLMF